MKAYILIPEKAYRQMNEDELFWLKNSFPKEIKHIFGNLEMILVSKQSINSVEIYFMEKARGNDDKSIIAYIISLLRAKLGPKLGANPQVKINYSIFNPGFNPKNDVQEEKVQNKVSKESGEFDYQRLAKNFEAIEPKFNFDQVVLPKAVAEGIEEAINILKVENKVFDEWGLRAISKEALSILNFYGPSGTGKSMAAEALASRLGKKLIKASYADIASQYFGVGPKMVKAMFLAAKNEDAVIFFDEAETVLSRRSGDASGANQELNAIKSQLLISLEQHKGIVIFASNLVISYDKAFLTRIKNISFTLPDENARERIWENHLNANGVHVPLNYDVNFKELAHNYQFSGREIKKAAISACISAASKGKNQVGQIDFIEACEKQLNENEDLSNAQDYTKAQDGIKSIIQNQLNKGEVVTL